jgi:hypothetical protein
MYSQVLQYLAQGARELMEVNLSYMFQVFNFKLGYFAGTQALLVVQGRPLLELKTRPSFVKPVG